MAEEGVEEEEVEGHKMEALQHSPIKNQFLCKDRCHKILGPP